MFTGYKIYHVIVCLIWQAIIECNEQKSVLGLHFTGPNAGEVMQGFAAAVRYN